jgi:hypothetical protein
LHLQVLPYFLLNQLLAPLLSSFIEPIRVLE